MIISLNENYQLNKRLEAQTKSKLKLYNKLYEDLVLLVIILVQKNSWINYKLRTNLSIQEHRYSLPSKNNAKFFQVAIFLNEPGILIHQSLTLFICP